MISLKARTVAAVDPGLNGAVAVYSPSRKVVQAYRLRPPTGKDWDTRVDSVVQQAVLLTGFVDTVVVEMPAFFQSVGGMRTARSGSLIKLALLAGRVFQAISAQDKRWVGVNEWKGNAPKHVVHRRAEKKLSLSGKLPGRWEKMSDDERDAVAMLVVCFKEHFNA